LHNQTSLMLVEAAYRAGDKALAEKITREVKKELQQEMQYYQAIGEKRADRMSFEVQRSQMLLQMLGQMEEVLNPKQGPEKQLLIGGDSGAQIK
jgi:hypothetical protein